MAKTIRVTLPKKYYQIQKEKRALTRYIKDSAGYFRGRYTGVPNYVSDNLKYARMKKSIDFNHDNIPDLKKGQIVSRLRRKAKVPKKLIINVHLSNGK